MRRPMKRLDHTVSRQRMTRGTLNSRSQIATSIARLEATRTRLIREQTMWADKLASTNDRLAQVHQQIDFAQKQLDTLRKQSTSSASDVPDGKDQDSPSVSLEY
ncbi:MAG: hypothetical protein AAF629_33765 [Chloroflexota bacterium]